MRKLPRKKKRRVHFLKRGKGTSELGVAIERKSRFGRKGQLLRGAALPSFSFGGKRGEASFGGNEQTNANKRGTRRCLSQGDNGPLLGGEKRKKLRKTKGKEEKRGRAPRKTSLGLSTALQECTAASLNREQSFEKIFWGKKTRRPDLIKKRGRRGEKLHE